MNAVDIRGKERMKRLLSGLERKGYIKTEKLIKRRGMPRIIIPLIDPEKGETQ